MGLPRRDALHHTYADYRTWPEGMRYELLDGTAYLVLDRDYVCVRCE
jgi:hypothetical protein